MSLAKCHKHHGPGNISSDAMAQRPSETLEMGLVVDQQTALRCVTPLTSASPSERKLANARRTTPIEERCNVGRDGR